MRILDFSKWTRWGAIPIAMIFAAPAFGQNSGSASTQQIFASASQVSVTPASLLARYPAGSIVSVAQANRALDEVKKGRTEIEVRFKSEEQACYETFMANKCVAEAKDRRRIALAEIKPIQIQADKFKRHEAVVMRDKALAEKRLKEEGKSKPDPGLDDRAGKFEAKQQQAQEKEQSLSGKRAENEAAFQKKTKDREAARAKVVEKRAKTEQRRKKKAADAANRKPPASSADASTGK